MVDLLIIRGQKILLDATEEELASLEVSLAALTLSLLSQVVDFVVPFSDLGDAKPQVNSTSACQV